MFLDNQNIEIQSGRQLQQAASLEASAGLVSSWLTAYAPNTKPKHIDVLVSQFADSYYATINGSIAGHIALSKFDEVINLDDLLNTDHLIIRESVHYGIGSLVVNMEVQSRGIGSMLLDCACEQVESKTTINPYDPLTRQNGYTYVSALAAETSLPLFLSRGFVPDPRLEFISAYSESDYDPLSGKTFVGKLFKWS